MGVWCGGSRCCRFRRGSRGCGSWEIGPEPRGGTEGCLTKPDGKAATSSGGSHWHSLDSVPSPGPSQRKYLCAGVPKDVYSVGLLGAKTEIPANSVSPLCRRCYTSRHLKEEYYGLFANGAWPFHSPIVCRPRQPDNGLLARFTDRILRSHPGGHYYANPSRGRTLDACRNVRP